MSSKRLHLTRFFPGRHDESRSYAGIVIRTMHFPECFLSKTRAAPVMQKAGVSLHGSCLLLPLANMIAAPYRPSGITSYSAERR